MTECSRVMPSFSIVIEWDNARFADLERTRRMLRSLAAQLAEIRTERAPEVYFLHERTDIDGAMVDEVVREEFPVAPYGVKVQVVGTDGLHYYEQKNHGARLASGEIVILLDCDIVPESDWLREILWPFSNPDVSVVAGDTYIEYDGLYSKAFALFWYFGLRDAGGELTPTTFFHANNVAFRSHVFASYPFPRCEGYRIQCGLLCKTLLAHGFGLYRHKGARASHPAPLGSYFYKRALRNGRDEVLLSMLADGDNRPRLRRIYWNYRACLVVTFQRFKQGRREVGLSLPEAIVAYGIAVSYFTLKAAGAILTYSRPRLAARLLPA